MQLETEMNRVDFDIEMSEVKGEGHNVPAEAYWWTVRRGRPFSLVIASASGSYFQRWKPAKQKGVASYLQKQLPPPPGGLYA